MYIIFASRFQRWSPLVYGLAYRARLAETMIAPVPVCVPLSVCAFVCVLGEKGTEKGQWQTLLLRRLMWQWMAISTATAVAVATQT